MTTIRGAGTRRRKILKDSGYVISSQVKVGVVLRQPNFSVAKGHTFVTQRWDCYRSGT